MTLKEKYEELVNQYLKKFNEKQGYEFDDWVGNDIGGIACFIEQYFFHFDDIRYDIDNNIESGIIFKWQDYCVEHGNPHMNYKTYSKWGDFENKTS